MPIFALCRDGRCLAWDFLEGLEARVRANFMQRMRVVADGQLLRRKFGHVMDDDKPPGKPAKGLFGFKDIPSQSRIMAFQTKIGGWILTHGFGEKKEDEFPSIEILRADEARKWFKPYEDAAVAAYEKSEAANREGRR